MEDFKIKKLIINPAYSEPIRYHKYNRETRKFEITEGRRDSGFITSSGKNITFDDPGVFIPIEVVNKIRIRVKEWKEKNYPGVTTVTKRLLEHWNDLDQREYNFFFCQKEAIETLIWYIEASPHDKVGIELEQESDFRRICSKMATGTGKTVVMAMLIAWQILNKVTYPKDTRFSKIFLVITPGLTIRRRLQVLDPTQKDNYYDLYSVVPLNLKEKLNQGKVFIKNWHSLDWQTEEKIKKRKTVDKRGVISNEAYLRSIFGNTTIGGKINVINDEAHHAWKIDETQKVSAEDKEQATKWIGALERIHQSKGILNCYDFSATPFIPGGQQHEDKLFKWIVSDFNLNDAIESGLVKTPRVVIRDDAQPDVRTYKSKLYHIYFDETVKDDLTRKAEPFEPLPDLVINAYFLLGYDWRETLKEWKRQKQQVPPVMITVANRVETSARLVHSFNNNKIKIQELCNKEKLLRIDSKVLNQAETTTDDVDYNFKNQDNLTKKQEAEKLRQQVDSIGLIGKPGEQIQNVISVNMLSEGWDAKTVTHIMGLRAFTSQLLCEQVVGRGLRRTAYDVDEETGLFDAEYVNVFGVPFTFLPHEISSEEGGPKPPKPKSRIEPDDQKKEFEISWPNVIRINTLLKHKLSLDLNSIKPLILQSKDIRLSADLAATIEGKTDILTVTSIELEKLAQDYRQQRIIFETARDLSDLAQQGFKGSKESLIVQLIKITEKFISSNKLIIKPESTNMEPLRRRLIITLSMTRVVEHLLEIIKEENYEEIEPIYDKDKPIKSTNDMFPWFTGKPCEHTKKSHINMCVYDSTWESSHSYLLDKNEKVQAWVKNDHLGFEIFYLFKGVVKKYRPDYIVKIGEKEFVILETKGKITEEVKAKQTAAEEWTRAINNTNKFGTWRYKLSNDPSDIKI